MTYQVLARKWRPQDFTSLVGQAHIVTALRNALTDDRIAQAYLFSGIRGVGKTTTARVLAKALNCRVRAEQGGADPCNTCTSCQEITAGGDLDVIEVDAATYSKVEQIRELTESLRYGPAHDRYKVVVLDEVHRLSRQAFDALLKIVEEPPAHLVFIFATTELDSVPATILSRCQQFQFRRVPSATLAPYLRELCERESITASDTALTLIARASEGSVRDAIALLDQLATFGSGTIEDQDANRLLGGFDSEMFQRLLAAILAGDSKTVSELVGDVEQNGWDPTTVYGHFLGYVRDALHLCLGRRHGDIDLPSDDAEALKEVVRDTGYENLLRLLRLLLDSEESIRRSEIAILALEIAWLRAAELPKLTAIETLLGGGGTGGGTRPERATPSPPPAAGPPGRRTRPAAAAEASTRTAPPRPSSNAPPPPTAAPRPAAPPHETAPRETAPREAAPTSAPPSRRNVAPEPDEPPEPPRIDSPRTNGARPGRGAEAIPQFLDRLRTQHQRLAAHLGQAVELTFSDHELAIHVADGDRLLIGALERTTNAEHLSRIAGEIWDQSVRWRIVRRRDAKPPAQPEAPVETESAPATASADDVQESETVQTTLAIFDGTIDQVEPIEDNPIEDDPIEDNPGN